MQKTNLQEKFLCRLAPTPFPDEGLLLFLILIFEAAYRGSSMSSSEREESREQKERWGPANTFSILFSQHEKKRSPQHEEEGRNTALQYSLLLLENAGSSCTPPSSSRSNKRSLLRSFTAFFPSHLLFLQSSIYIYIVSFPPIFLSVHHFESKKNLSNDNKEFNSYQEEKKEKGRALVVATFCRSI